jgi:hypothetical protein
MYMYVAWHDYERDREGTNDEQTRLAAK